MTLKSFIKDEKGVIQLVMLSVALLIIFVIIQILPVVNSNISAAVPLPGYVNSSNSADGIRPGGEWNSSINLALTNSSTMWSGVGGIFKVTLIVAIIAVLLAYLFSVVPRGGTPGGGL